MTYKLLNGQNGQPCGVTIVGQNIFIPLANGNADYQRYLEWVAEGNTPLPADEAQ